MSSAPPLPPAPRARHLRPGDEIPSTYKFVAFLVAFVGAVQVLDRLVPGWSSSSWVAPGLVVLGLVAFGVYLGRKRAFNRANEAAVEHMNAGRLPEAARAFERNARLGTGLARAASVYNLAVARLRLGEHAGALELFGALERSRWGRETPLGRHVPGFFALALAARGDAAAAEAWLEVALRRNAGTATEKQLPVLAEAAVRCRQARFAEALAALEARGEDACRLLPPEFARVLSLLWAYALERQGRPGAEVAARLAPAAARPTELAYVTASWPELGDFLSRAGASPAA